MSVRWRLWAAGIVAGVLGLLGLARWASGARRAGLKKQSRKRLDQALYDSGRLQNERQRALSYVADTDTVIVRIDKQLEQVKEDATKEIAEVEGMSHEQVEAELSEMGL